MYIYIYVYIYIYKINLIYNYLLDEKKTDKLHVFVNHVMHIT